MPSFSDWSKNQLSTADPRLQEVFNFVIQNVDCKVLQGWRGKTEQDKAVAEGKSKTMWPTSRHNKTPSQAVDVMPCPIEWPDMIGLTPEEKEKARNYATVAYFAGIVRGVAMAKGINITWGGDWNRDFKLTPGDDWDMPHYQVEP